MGCFLDDLKAFGINADQWTTAAQEEEEWRRTAKQWVEYFMAKWIAAEKNNAGPRPRAGFFYINLCEKPINQSISQSVPMARCNLSPPISMSCRFLLSYYYCNNDELYVFFYDHITVSISSPDRSM